MIKKIVSILIIVMVLLVSSCSVQSNDKKDNSSKLSVDKLITTYVTSPLNVPSILEKKNQTFSKYLNGVSVEYAEITSGSEQTQALASGSVNLLHAVGGASVVAAAAAGMDIRIVSMYSRAPKAFALYSKDSNLKSAKDLKGKKIAGPMGTNLHELLVAYLNKEGMSLSDVEYINLSIPDAYAALESGNIDVALLGGPAGYKAIKNGYHKIVDGEGYIEAIIAVATTQKYYDEHKDVIDLLMKAQKELRDTMSKDANKTKEVVVDILKITPEAYDAMFGQYDFSLDITDKDIKGLQKTADFMLNAGMIKSKVDVSGLFIK